MTRCERIKLASLALASLTLAGCSTIFPHTELAIAPEGATLDELGLGIVADVERWVTSILWVLGVAGL